MSKNFIVPIVIVILVLIFGVFVLLGNNANNTNQIQNGASNSQTADSLNLVSSTTSQTSSANVATTTAGQIKNQITVVYNGTSFSPSTVNVKKGESVLFVNQSSGEMEVASNPHPTHTDYPEFDQTKSSQKGDISYVFTFTKIGTWGYHNHVNPAVKGTVVVNP